MIYEALIKNDGTIFRLVFTADNDVAARVHAEDQMVSGDSLVGVFSLRKAA